MQSGPAGGANAPKNAPQKKKSSKVTQNGLKKKF